MLSSVINGIQTKRKVFFSFHYADVKRANVVRENWKNYMSYLQTPTILNYTVDLDDSYGFYDGSLWESKKLEGEIALKALITEGMKNTSACCVLVGTETYQRRWVKYEIARSVVDERGLLAVHINNIEPSKFSMGYNPLDLIGICRINGQYYLRERSINDGLWRPYMDYVKNVPLPKYLIEPNADYYTTPLRFGSREYDFRTLNGYSNIGRWIDEAAKAVGR